MTCLTFTVDPADAGIRLDKYLSDHIDDLSRSAVTKLMEDGKVRIGEKPASKSIKTSAGDAITVEVDDPQPVDIIPEDIPLDIVYEDDHLLVVNKPKGMVVHPAPGNYSGTLVNALMFRCGDRLSGINGELRPGIAYWRSPNPISPTRDCPRRSPITALHASISPSPTAIYVTMSVPSTRRSAAIRPTASGCV